MTGSEQSGNQEVEFNFYADDNIQEIHPEPKVHFFLKITYIFLPLLGLFLLYKYWNGSEGWLDPDHWRGLQEAAKTIYPYQPK